jgi:hypothetical protein
MICDGPIGTPPVQCFAANLPHPPAMHTLPKG